MAEVMRFWFGRGVDGFRVDAIFAAIKDELLRDNPPDRRASASFPGWGASRGQDPLWSMNRPEVHDVIRHLRRVADEFPGRVLVGEAYLPVEELARLPRPRRGRRVPSRLRLRAARSRRGSTAT